jgi:hypothetical protein
MRPPQWCTSRTPPIGNTSTVTSQLYRFSDFKTHICQFPFLSVARNTQIVVKGKYAVSASHNFLLLGKRVTDSLLPSVVLIREILRIYMFDETTS